MHRDDDGVTGYSLFKTFTSHTYCCIIRFAIMAMASASDRSSHTAHCTSQRPSITLPYTPPPPPGMPSDPPLPPQFLTCLGDLYSVAWLEDAEARDLTQESLAGQYLRVKVRGRGGGGGMVPCGLRRCLYKRDYTIHS